MKAHFLNNSWTVPLLSAGVAGLYFFFVFLPSQKTMAGVSEELAAQQETVAQASALAPAVKVTGQELHRTLQYGSAWGGSAPTEANVAELFGRIHTLAKTAGLSVMRFDPQDPKKLVRVIQIPVTLGCSGQFSQIARFLQDLESLPQGIWVDSMRVEISKASSENVECEISLIIFADNPENSDQANLSG